MGDILFFGACIGGVIGALHAIHFVATRLAGPGSPLRTIWHGAWLLVLWTALGTYVLALWLIGVLVLVIAKAVSSTPEKSGARVTS